jgi:tetratricopeptide (TPR) repeat protein
MADLVEASGDGSAAARAPVKRYKAFISYSWADRAWGEWVHRALETYKTPKALIGKPGAMGPVPARLAPIFKDREEEAAGAGITASIEAAMAASDFMIVICSPQSAQSKWVNHEIAWYKSRRDKRRVLALVVGGEPGASFVPGREAEECFPKSLLYVVGDDLQPTDEKEDVPLAADARPIGDHKRGAKLKLAAAMLGLGLDDLVRREERRRAIRRRLVTTALAVFSVWMTGNTWFAITQRNEAQAQRRLAEQQTENVNAALDYLVSLFEIANPATENPETITALTVLERGRAKIDAELGDKPMVRARLLSAIGSAYQGLGKIKDAEPILADGANGPFASVSDEVLARMHHADALTRLNKFEESRKLIDFTDDRISSALSSISPAELDYFKTQITQQRATLAYSQSKYEAAITEYRLAKSLCQRTTLCEPNRMATIANNLSVALSESGKTAEARDELLLVRDIYLKEYGPDHLKSIITTHNIAYTDFLAGEYQAPLESLPVVVTAYEKLLPDADNHPLQAAAKVLLGRIYDAVGKSDEAISAMTQSREIYEKAFGLENNQVSTVNIYLALALAKNGQGDEALVNLDKARAIIAKNYSPDDPSFGDLEAHRGLVLAMAGRAAEAAAACRRGVAQMAKSLPPEDSWLQEIAAQCAPIVARAG